MYIEARVPIPMTTFLNVECNSPYICIIYCGRGNGMERNGRRNSNTFGTEGRKERQAREEGGEGGNNCCLRRCGQTFFNYWSAQKGRNCRVCNGCV